jgi:hypothetical protein
MICTVTRNRDGFEYTEEIHRIPFRDSIALSRDNCHIFYGIEKNDGKPVASLGQECLPFTYKTVVTVENCQYISVDRFTLHPIWICMTVNTLYVYRSIKDTFDYRYRLKLYNDKYGTHHKAIYHESDEENYVIVGMIDKETIKRMYEDVHSLMSNCVVTNARIGTSITNLIRYGGGAIALCYTHEHTIPYLRWKDDPDYSPNERLELDDIGLPRISAPMYCSSEKYEPINDWRTTDLFKDLCYISREVQLLCNREVPHEILYGFAKDNQIDTFLYLCNYVISQQGMDKIEIPHSNDRDTLHRFKNMLQDRIMKKLNITCQTEKPRDIFSEVMDFLIHE